jgi:hypothetical protein
VSYFSFLCVRYYWEQKTTRIDRPSFRDMWGSFSGWARKYLLKFGDYATRIGNRMSEAVPKTRQPSDSRKDVISRRRGEVRQRKRT